MRRARSVTVTATLDDAGVGVADDVAGGVDRDVADDGDVRGVVRRMVACTPVSPVNPEVRQATCVDWCGDGADGDGGVGSDGGLRTALIRRVRMTPGTATHTVTVTATLADGFSVGAVAGRVVAGRSTTRRRRSPSMLPAASCDEVTPVAPTGSTQAVCRGGVLVAPTLTLADDRWDHLHAPIRRGRMRRCQTVTVTATLDDAEVGWPDDVAGGVDARRVRRRRRTGCRSAVVACTPVSPVDPEVMQATCADGAVTVPTVTAASGPTGVIYSVDPAGPYDAGDGDSHGDGDGDVG